MYKAIYEYDSLKKSQNNELHFVNNHTKLLNLQYLTVDRFVHNIEG